MPPERAPSGYPRLVLGPILRYVDGGSATIWVETDRACTVAVLGHCTPTFAVAGHHYALVVVSGLAPATATPYDVRLDGALAWPPPSWGLPHPVIRTRAADAPLQVLFCSCRSAAPHVAPYTLSLDADERGRGVDALRAYGLGLLDKPPTEWPDLMVFVGDQVYADDPSPAAQERIRAERGEDSGPDAPPVGMVAGFEEYTWLYHESWEPDVERWMLSVIPSAMVFDDHDMIDDWNISAWWVDDIRSLPWWDDHVVGGLVSYWVYQHLGNLSPSEIAAEGMLARFVEAGDATNEMWEWARESEAHTPVFGGYQFSFSRDLGRTRLVVVDCRNGRLLDPSARRILDDGEWAWLCQQVEADVDHLLIATSVPVFMVGGLSDFERWSEAVCDGRWGRRASRLGEKLRRGVDLDHWPAFDTSFNQLVRLFAALAGRGDAPATVSVLSGDVHFSYRAPVTLRGAPTRADGIPVTRVNQIVCSPTRNVLRRRERRVLRFATSRAGRLLGRALRRSVGGGVPDASWSIEEGPLFANAVATIDIDGKRAHLTLSAAHSDEEGRAVLEPAFDTSL